MHMFSTLLVSDRYSQDSDVPTLSDVGKVENEGVSCSHLLMSSDEYSPSQIVLVVSEDVEDSNRGGSLQFNHFSCSCFKRDLLVGNICTRKSPKGSPFLFTENVQLSICFG